jgi:hypothetical protein
MPHHLKAGNDLATLKANALTLHQAGWPKAKAIDAVFRLAAYLPPQFPASRTSTKSSPDAS